MMVAINAFPKGLGAVATWKQARQRRDKGAPAVATGVAAGVDEKHARGAKAVEMACPSSIAALAAEAYASAARAEHAASFGGSQVDVELILALAFEHPISFNVDSVIHRGHAGGHPASCPHSLIKNRTGFLIRCAVCHMRHKSVPNSAQL